MALFLNYHVITFVSGLTLAAPFFILQHRITNSPNTAMKSTDDKKAIHHCQFVGKDCITAQDSKR